MDIILPRYSEFVKIEQRTLVHIRNELAKRKTFARAAADVYKTLGSHDKQSFNFSTSWDVEYMNTNCRIFIGALIRKYPSHDKICWMTHYLSIAENTDTTWRILRKFHFDYVTQDKMHPCFHLQYGGELPPAMNIDGIEDKHIEPLLPKVRQPRIFFTPVTIALLMNMLFYEFQSDDIDIIREGLAWQKIIRDNERDILVRYYERCAELAGKCGIIFSKRVYVA